MLRAITCKKMTPLGFARGASFTRVPRTLDGFGNFEGVRRPAERLARRRHFLDAKRLAMRRLGALLVRCAPADDGLAADDGRPRGFRARPRYRARHGLGTMTV